MIQPHDAEWGLGVSCSLYNGPENCRGRLHTKMSQLYTLENNEYIKLDLTKLLSTPLTQLFYKCECDRCKRIEYLNFNPDLPRIIY